MTHRVIITQKAKDDLRHYCAVAAQHAPETAARWLNRFEESLRTLSDNPTRCSLEMWSTRCAGPFRRFRQLIRLVRTGGSCASVRYRVSADQSELASVCDNLPGKGPVKADPAGAREWPP